MTTNNQVLVSLKPVAVYILLKTYYTREIKCTRGHLMNHSSMCIMDLPALQTNSCLHDNVPGTCERVYLVMGQTSCKHNGPILWCYL